jgi:hypothetical protein
VVVTAGQYLDADLRTAITRAAVRGGFVLLVGGSSVGKTRALFEAVRAVLPEWWLVHPADTDEIREFALAPTPRTVLWLDELQRYLNQPGGLPAGSVRALVAAGGSCGGHGVARRVQRVTVTVNRGPGLGSDKHEDE